MHVTVLRNKKYTVTLTDAEREELMRLIAAGTAPARKLTHARILLRADHSPLGPAGWMSGSRRRWRCCRRSGGS